MLRTVIDRLPIGWAGRLALQRLLSQWRSLLTIIAGTLLGAAVGALVPLYTTAVAQVSMVEKLDQLPVQDVHVAANISLIAAQTPKLSDTVQGYDSQFRQIVDQHLTQAFPGWLNRVVFYGETSALDVDPPAEVADPGAAPVIPDPTTRTFVAYYDGWTDAVLLINGRFPTDTPAQPDADIEIVVPLEAQNNFGVKVGDVLLLDQGGPRGGWPTSKNVRALVVGVVNLPDQLKPLQRAYFMAPSPLRIDKGSGSYKADYPVLTTRASFERVAISFVPDTPTRFGWRVLFDHTRLPFPRSPAARQALFDLSGNLDSVFSPPDKPRELAFNYHTGLIDWKVQGGQNYDAGALLAYERSVKTLETPFGLLLLQVGALVIFFLIVTAALVRRGERREIAMLQSRGAMDRHIVVIRGIEALAICTLAAIIAPILSQQLLIAITPFFASYANLPLTLTSTVFVYATAAAAIAFLALMFTLRPVLRLPLITSGGATLRSARQPWWQRYYLDVFLVILGITALWRLVGRDTPLFTTNAGTRTTDPFLLLAPALLFLGLGSILLRLFPVIAAVVSRILGAGRGLIGPMATWQLSREPIHYGRITFLLALAIGIGWFATSFRATVNRSQTDQAQYQVGTDVRFNERDLRLNVTRTRPEVAYTQLPGVQAATTLWRQPVINVQGDPAKDSLLGELLAVNSDSFRQTLYWRSDLGTVNTPRPAGQPISLPQRGEELPFVPQKLNLWAEFTVPGAFGAFVPDLDRLRNRTTIYARLLDSTGSWLQVPFKVAEIEYNSTGPQRPGITGGNAFMTDGWAYFEADLTALAYKPIGPVRLVSMYWQHRGRSNNGEINLRLTLSGLTATNDQGQKLPLDLFRHSGWEFAYDSGAYSEGRVSEFTSSHGDGITAYWQQRASSARLGLLLNYPASGNIPIIASDSMMAQLDLQVGQVIKVREIENTDLSLVIQDSQRYYPTLYDAQLADNRWIVDEQNHPFIVTDLDALLYAVNRRPSANVYPEEVWLKTSPGADIDNLLKALHPADRSSTILNVQTLPGELSNLQTDPLSLGLLGLMLLAFIVAMALSIVGLLTYATLTAAARRSEFGVLRALGLSSPRLIAQLAFEQIFVIGLGTLLGSILGIVLSNQVVPRLALDTANKTIVPPFIVQVETTALAQYGLLIFGVLLLVLLSSLLIVRRMSLTRTLRLGEE